MIFSVQQIKYEFLAYMKEFGGSFNQWYVGVANNPEQVLFSQHNVDREKDYWIFKPALSFRATTTVLQYFREKLKTDGADVGVGSDEMTYVYTFKKSATTIPGDGERPIKKTKHRPELGEPQ